jgi:MinD-like ATPase involved in chromosome partitioning or flagellar assembly
VRAYKTIKILSKDKEEQLKTVLENRIPKLQYEHKSKAEDARRVRENAETKF